MKKLLIAIAVLYGFKAGAQVTWHNSAKQISKNVYEVHITAALQKSWHIYSTTTPDGGPLPSRLIYDGIDKKALGPVQEKGRIQSRFEPVFNVQVKYFEDSVTFIQKVTFKTQAPPLISGAVEYMLCNNRQCMPPAKWTFNIKPY